MAIVYKAYDTRLESEVAVKVIRIERLAPEILQRAMKRFEREAKSLAQLTHPNLVKVLDYGEYEGQPYLVMPYLPGGTLKQKMSGQPMPWQEAARLLIPIARALDYAHKRNLIHRDVKPSNILITESGEPMLTDFGVAKIIDEEATLDLTGTSAAVGTPEYMAPEQATSKNVDHRADIYALGIVFYEMVTGRRPFQADTPLAVLFKQASEPLPRPSQFIPSLPDAVEKILLKALAKRPEDRYQGMGEVAHTLESLLSGASTVAQPQLAPSKPYTALPHERTRDTQNNVQQRRIPNIKESAVSQPISTPNAISSASSGLFRYWPIGLISLLGIGLIIAALVRNSNSVASSPVTPSANITVSSTIVPTIHTESPTPTTLPTQTPIPPPEDEIVDAMGVVMRLVPAGEFLMGSDSGSEDEKPVHQIYLDNYYMDKYEVTNALYQACVLTGICTPPHITSSNTNSNYYGNTQFADYPVINVDWYQANVYCEWRDSRLPTEAEWEKAARGTSGYTYPWGEGEEGKMDCKMANYGECTSDTTAVGSYPAGASPYDILDMAGNVREWVADWYLASYYDNSPTKNPLGPDTGTHRVVRSGSWGGSYLRAWSGRTWYVFDFSVRSSFRGSGVPELWVYNLGFRCARSLP